MRKNRKLTALGAGTLSLAGVLTTTTPASAGGVGLILHTRDDKPGGTAEFIADKDKLSVCDNQRDGYSARAQLFIKDGSNRVIFEVTDKTGNGHTVGNSHCIEKRKPSLPDGRLIHFRVFLFDNDNPRKMLFTRTMQVET